MGISADNGLPIDAARHRLTVPDVRAWVAGAQPGARLVYAVGFNADLHAAPGVAEEMRGVEALGYVYLVQQRGQPFKSLYLAQRSSRPLTDPKKAQGAMRRVALGSR